MSSSETETETPPKPRKTRSTSSKRKPRKTRTAPPKNVQPGAIHETIAAFLLNGLQGRTVHKIGQPLNVGDLSEADKVLISDDNPESTEPVELLARVLAHIGHRIPFFSTVEKKLEGKDARSGFLADVIALVVQLWTRNRHLAPLVMAAAQQQRKNAAPPEQPVTDVTGATGFYSSQTNGGVGSEG